MQKLSQFCSRLSGIHKYGFLCLMGCLSALAMAPTYLFFVLFVTLPALFFTLKTAETKKQSFFAGWFFALGYFTCGLYWISFALFVDFATWWWVTPFALFALPMALAIYTGLATLTAWYVTRHHNNPLPLYSALVTALGISEMARSFLFTGFPWNLWGYTWLGNLPMAQNLSWAGIHMLSVLTLLWALSPVLCVAKKKSYYIIPLVSLIMMLFCYGYGAYRLNMSDDLASDDRYYMRIVQPNIPQKEKWQRDKQWKNFDKLIALSSEPSDKPLTHIIWPETALTISSEYNREVQAHITHLLSKTHKDALLMTGNIRVDGKKFYNSFRIYNQTGLPQTSFDKAHLVPFGEYIPFRDYINLSPLGSQLSGTADFTSGTGPYQAQYKNTPQFSPLICYEVIFPHKAMKKTQQVDLLINATNDGWYGHTSGPYQHLGIAQARAIETGRPLIRAAGTGISAYIDPYGRLVKKAPLNTQQNIDFSIGYPVDTYFAIHLIIVTAWLSALLAITSVLIFRKINT